MFGLGFLEILILILIAFLVFGPEQFPSIAKNFLKLLNEFKQTFMGIKTELDSTKASAQKKIQQITKDVSKDLNLIKDSDFKIKNEKTFSKLQSTEEEESDS